MIRVRIDRRFDRLTSRAPIMPLYFAYGSNLDPEAMADRCPASRSLGPARLMGHRFVLMREGYASVGPDPAGCVHGLLWNLALRDMAALDRYESVAQGLYAKTYRSVASGQGPKRALVYIGCNSGPGAARPGYIEGVIAAARALRLPGAYLAELRTHLPTSRAGAGQAGRATPRLDRLAGARDVRPG